MLAFWLYFWSGCIQIPCVLVLKHCGYMLMLVFHAANQWHGSACSSQTEWQGRAGAVWASAVLVVYIKQNEWELWLNPSHVQHVASKVVSQGTQVILAFTCCCAVCVWSNCILLLLTCSNEHRRSSFLPFLVLTLECCHLCWAPS